MKRLIEILAVLVMAASSLSFSAEGFQSSSQPATVVVTVFDSLSRNPLPNADVMDLSSGQVRITDDNGKAYLVWPAKGTLQLRVRQIGYQPRQLDFTAAPSGNAVPVALQRVAYVLSSVRSVSKCSNEVDTVMSGVSAVALGQLKQAAGKYNDFRKAYPFEASVERRSAVVPREGDVKRIVVSNEKFSSEKFEGEYRPGNVIARRSGEFTVPLLFISTLADSVFWEHHCFATHGFQTYQGARVIRLEFFPTRDVDGPDYKGSAVLDSATSMLLRVDFELANPPRRSGPTRLEGYTTFISPSPFVVLPDTTGAVWWLREPDKGDWGKPDYMQALYVKELRYRKAKPPAYSESK
jgi:hypothetical protein